MKTYKYKTIKYPTEITESKLNEFGRRGYELVSVSSSEWGYVYYFKIETSE